MKHTIRVRTTLALTFAAFALTVVVGGSRPAMADETEDARKVIDSRHEEIRTVISSTTDAEAMRDKIRKSMDEFVHYEMFSKLAAKTFWDEMKPEQQTEYVGLFTRLIQRTYLKRFKAGKPFEVKLIDTQLSSKKDKALVKSEITSGKVSAFVDYKLFQPDGQPDGKTSWWVYDVVIDEVSVMRNYRTSFNKTWKKGGYDLLISKMKSKLDKVEKSDEEEGDEEIGELD